MECFISYKNWVHREKFSNNTHFTSHKIGVIIPHVTSAFSCVTFWIAEFEEEEIEEEGPRDAVLVTDADSETGQV